MALRANRFFKVGLAALLVLAALPLVLDPVPGEHCPTPTQLAIEAGPTPSGEMSYCIAEVPRDAVRELPRRRSTLCQAEKPKAERFRKDLTIARQIEHEHCLRNMPGLYAWMRAHLKQRMRDEQRHD